MFKQVIISRLESLKAFYNRTTASLASVIAIVALYDLIGSQFIAEDAWYHPPKIYKVAEELGALLSPKQWMWTIFVLFIFAGFEHLHRERLGKRSPIPVLFLFMGCILAVMSIFRADEIRDNTAQINNIYAKYKDLKLVADKNAQKIDGYISYLQDKSAINTYENEIKEFKSGADSVLDNYCSILSTPKKENTSSTLSFGRMPSPPMGFSVISKQESIDVIPVDIDKRRTEFINAWNSNNLQSLSSATYALSGSCVHFRDNIEQAVQKIRNKQNAAKSRVTQFQQDNKFYEK